MMKKFKNKKACLMKLQRSGGFTVLESIVAIAIISLSVSGAFSAVTQSLSQATIAKDEIKAFSLAQEAVEIIRNKRDSNQLTFANTGNGFWLSGIAQNNGDPCFFGSTCRVDATPIPPTLTRCSGSWGTCPVLNQNPTTFLYSYGAYPATNFKREVQIESVSPDEIVVTVRISWTKGILNKEFIIKTHLFNWI